MARNILEMIIRAEDDFSGTFNKFQGKFNALGNNMRTLTAPIVGATKAIAGLATGFAAAGIALDASSIMNASKAQTAMAGLRKVFNGTGKELKKLEKDAVSFSIKFGTSIENVIKAQEAWAVEGKNLQDIRTGMNASQKLSIAGDISESDAALRLSAIMAGLGGKFETVNHLVDAANAVGNQFGTTTDSITEGLTRFVGVARQQNLSLEQMIGLFTGVDVVTKNAGESGNALKTILIRLHQETDKNTKAWEILGLSHKNADGTFKNSFQLLGEIAGKMNSLTDSQKQYVAQVFAGIFHVSKFNVLMKNFGIAVNASTAALNSHGSAQKEVDILLATTTKKVESATKAWSALNKQIGDVQLQSVGQLADAFTKAVVAMSEWESTANATGIVFNEFLKPAVDAFVIALTVLAENFPQIMKQVDFSKLENALKGLSASLAGIFDADLSKPQGWSDAIQKASDTAASFINVVAGMTDVLNAVTEAGKPMVTFFNALPASMKNTVGALGVAATAFTALIAPLEAVGLVALTFLGVWTKLKAIMASPLSASIPTPTAGAGAGGGAVAGGATEAAGLGKLASILTKVGGITTVVTAAIWFLTESQKAEADVSNISANNQLHRLEALNQVNRALGTNFKTVEEALGKLHAQNAATLAAADAEALLRDGLQSTGQTRAETNAQIQEGNDALATTRETITGLNESLIGIKENLNIAITTDLTQLETLKTSMLEINTALTQTATAMGSTADGAGAIASQIAATEQERLARLTALFDIESQLNEKLLGMATAFETLTNAQNSLIPSFETLGSRMDALTSMLSQSKEYKVDVTVDGADGAIHDLVSRVLEEVIIRIKQENLLTISDG